VKKEDRTYLMYLEDMQIAMNRITEYIDGMNFIDFKRDYEIIWDIATNHIPDNKVEIEKIIEFEKV